MSPRSKVLYHCHCNFQNFSFSHMEKVISLKWVPEISSISLFSKSLLMPTLKHFTNILQCFFLGKDILTNILLCFFLGKDILWNTWTFLHLHSDQRKLLEPHQKWLTLKFYKLTWPSGPTQLFEPRQPHTQSIPASLQYSACLAITGTNRGTSREILYHKLGLESLRPWRWYS